MATVAEAAEHLFLSERRFYELLGEGVITRAGPGAYELELVREQYIEHLREAAAGRQAEPGALDLAGERARLASAQADGQEMRNAAARRELLPREDVHMAVAGAFARVRAKLLGLPSKVAPLTIGMKTPAAAKAVLEKHIHEALRELATTEIAGAAAATD